MSSCADSHCQAGFSTARRPIWAIAFFSAMWAASVAEAATITVHPEDAYGRIFVDVAGEMTFADIKQFSDKVGALPSEKVYVSLSSDGGDAVAAAIGDLIRLSGMKTVVPENKRCISACAFIWLGSPDRYLGSENSVVGFHGAYNPNTGQPGHFNLKIAVYLGYLGFSYDAVEWILGAPPLAIRWLTPETSKQYSIYYSELAPRRSVPFVDDQLANLPLPPKPPVEPAISAPIHPTPPPVYTDQSSSNLSLFCIIEAGRWGRNPAGDGIIVRVTESRAGWTLHVVHKVDGQLYDRNMQYQIFAFRQDQNRRSYYSDGVLTKNGNVLMTGHLWLNARAWYYNEFVSFKDGSQPVKAATPTITCQPTG